MVREDQDLQDPDQGGSRGSHRGSQAAAAVEAERPLNKPLHLDCSEDAVAMVRVRMGGGVATGSRSRGEDHARPYMAFSIIWPAVIPPGQGHR